MTQMQGIVSILRSDDPEKSTQASSLRRTLSADMSSRCWLPDNGSPVIKNIEIDSSSSSSSSFDYVDDEKCKKTRKGDVNPSRIDVWTAIMSQKKQDDLVNLSSPYVHPLVKKSASSLSEKSLKVCTESLGSETGSDVFSSNDQQEEKQVHKVVRLACLSTRRSQQARSFPPPVSSVATVNAGPSLHMHARRVDGRLVLEAVSVPQQKYFEAQRQDGRFLLTLINDPKTQPSQHGFEDGVNVSDEATIKIVSVDKEIGSLNERPLNSTVTVKRINTKEGKIMEDVIDPPRRRATGLPPIPALASATLVNSYQYFWRAKPTVASVIDPVMTQHVKATNKNQRSGIVKRQQGRLFATFIEGLQRAKKVASDVGAILHRHLLIN